MRTGAAALRPGPITPSLTFAAESLTFIINVYSEMLSEVFNHLSQSRPQAPIAHLAEDRE
jgi:hypothetical protein